VFVKFLQIFLQYLINIGKDQFDENIIFSVRKILFENGKAPLEN